MNTHRDSSQTLAGVGSRPLRLAAALVVIGLFARPVAVSAQAAAAAPVVPGFDGPPAPDPPKTVSRDAEGRVTVRAVRLDHPIVVDGRLDDEVYGSVEPISGFVQQEPREGQAATERTDAWLLFDGRAV